MTPARDIATLAAVGFLLGRECTRADETREASRRVDDIRHDVVEVQRECRDVGQRLDARFDRVTIQHIEALSVRVDRIAGAL